MFKIKQWALSALTAMALLMATKLNGQIITQLTERLYVVTSSEDNIALGCYVARLNPETGGIVSSHRLGFASPPIPPRELSIPKGIAAQGNNVYIVAHYVGETFNEDLLGVLEQETGFINTIGPVTPAMASIAFGADGNLYGITGEESPGTPETEKLYSIDTATGEATYIFTVGSFPFQSGEEIAFTPDSLMYRSNGTYPAKFSSVDISAQMSNLIRADYTQAKAMGWAPQRSKMFVINVSPDNNPNFVQLLFTVNLTTGVRTAVASLPWIDNLLNADKVVSMTFTIPPADCGTHCGE